MNHHHHVHHLLSKLAAPSRRLSSGTVLSWQRQRPSISFITPLQSHSTLPSPTKTPSLLQIYNRRQSSHKINSNNIIDNNNINQHYQPSSIRSFGSKAAVASSSTGDNENEKNKGEIFLENEQTDLMLNMDDLRNTIDRIRSKLGYPTYDVSLLLCGHKYMKKANKDSRGINAPTDILSFPFLEAEEPGQLEAPQFDIPDYYQLGDMIIDVPYVMECCRVDQLNYQEQQQGQEAEQSPPPPPQFKEKEGNNNKGTKESETSQKQEETDVDDVEEEYDSDDEYEEDDDRGVSGAMATVFDPEERIHMLLVHGMLHLVGYDHETDEDYYEMVEQEERLLQELGYPRRKQQQQQQ